MAHKGRVKKRKWEREGKSTESTEKKGDRTGTSKKSHSIASTLTMKAHSFRQFIM